MYLCGDSAAAHRPDNITPQFHHSQKQGLCVYIMASLRETNRCPVSRHCVTDGTINVNFDELHDNQRPACA